MSALKWHMTVSVVVGIVIPSIAAAGVIWRVKPQYRKKQK
jgi:hypothetical protein